MKNSRTLTLAGILLLTTFSGTAKALDIANDPVTASIEKRPTLTEQQVRDAKELFHDYITTYKCDQFTGQAQYVLSSLNLSLKSDVRYSVELNGTVLFQIATNGNAWWGRGDATWPMQGLVYFELKDKQGQPVKLQTDEGKEVTFSGQKGIFYVVESEKNLEVRKVQKIYNKQGVPAGRFFAIVQYDLLNQKIDFYELVENDGKATLARRGSFEGIVPHVHRNN